MQTIVKKDMATSLLMVASLLVCFGKFGNIKPAVGQDLVSGNSSIASSQCATCCNKIATQATLLNRIVTRQDWEIQSLVEIRGKVVADFPLDLEKLSTDFDALKTIITDDISSEMEQQSTSLRRIEASLVSFGTTMSTLSRTLQLLEDRMKVQEQLFTALNPAMNEIRDTLVGPKDCSDIRALGHTTSGVYRVYPGSLAKRIQADVYCDMITPGGNWLVFQRRKDGSVNFKRTWSDYVAGFGNVSNGEFWLGNELLYRLTSNGKYKLRVDLEDFDGQKRYAEYSNFIISSSSDRYRLTVGGFTGDAGDSFTGHSGMQFSTIDADNDINKEGSCSLQFHGGWWYSACHASNLNGLYLGGPHKSYADGIEWYAFRGYYYSLKTTEMKIAVAD